VKINNVALQSVLDVIDRLVAPAGCPWDKKQTPASLCDYLIEECFELVEAIRSDDTSEIREEMGDVFFLLLFIGHWYTNHELFSLDQVWEENATKMIRRHPHVFGDQNITDIGELYTTWEKIKKEEKAEKQQENKKVFSSLPRSLPPLLRAYRINAKAARVGFTWDKDTDQEAKLQEEWQEWLEAKRQNDPKKMEEEFGDYLFSLTEYARRHNLKANTCLSTANNKFLSRFEKLEDLAVEKGLDISEMSLQEMDVLWDEVKQKEK
jgi:ATP diphosphatase